MALNVDADQPVVVEGYPAERLLHAGRPEGTHGVPILGMEVHVQPPTGLFHGRSPRPLDFPHYVVETGIYNLTENQTECLMHFGTEHTQTWLLVRMEEPKQAEDEGGQSG